MCPGKETSDVLEVNIASRYLVVDTHKTGDQERDAVWVIPFGELEDELPVPVACVRMFLKERSISFAHVERAGTVVALPKVDLDLGTDIEMSVAWVGGDIR